MRHRRDCDFADVRDVVEGVVGGGGDDDDRSTDIVDDPGTRLLRSRRRFRFPGDNVRRPRRYARVSTAVATTAAAAPTAGDQIRCPQERQR